MNGDQSVPMLPPRLMTAFQNAPAEFVDLCRPHSWDELIAVPGQGMRSICDILVHLIDAETGWIDHVVRGNPRLALAPESFQNLDQIFALWTPRRATTVQLIQGLTTDDRASTRPLPWNAAEFATAEEIVWHVVTHEQFHRGQVFTRLGLLGRRDLPDLDVIRAS
jgi:uncharacterized damage-inducible protein DinB